jgi:cell division protein YceG involved in septum cleavage
MEGNIEIRAKTENKLFPEGTDWVFFYSDKEKNKQYSQNMQLHAIPCCVFF